MLAIPCGTVFEYMIIVGNGTPTLPTRVCGPAVVPANDTELCVTAVTVCKPLKSTGTTPFTAMVSPMANGLYKNVKPESVPGTVVIAGPPSVADNVNVDVPLAVLT